ALRDNPAQGGQEQEDGSRQRRLPEVGGDQKVQDVADRAQVVVSSGGAAAASVINPVCGCSGVGADGLAPKPGRRSRIAPMKLAAMLKRINAWRTKTRLPDTPASDCITAPPPCSAPNRNAASTMPTALPSPRRATAMASKPVVSVKYLSVRLWSTP